MMIIFPQMQNKKYGNIEIPYSHFIVKFYFLFASRFRKIKSNRENPHIEEPP